MVSNVSVGRTVHELMLRKPSKGAFGGIGLSKLVLTLLNLSEQLNRRTCSLAFLQICKFVNLQIYLDWPMSVQFQLIY